MKSASSASDRLQAEDPHLWATSSFGDSPGTKPAELEALREHFSQCSGGNAHVVALQCGLLRLRGFMLSRLVTTLALAALGAATTLLLLA